MPCLSRELLGYNLHEALKKQTFSLSKASTECIILLISLSFYNIYFMFMIVHLCVGILWKLVALWTPPPPLQEYLVYPTKEIE
jgi:hypothetical protein